MPQLSGSNRNQLQLLSLETLISADNPVRVLDAYVSSLDLPSLGFEEKGQQEDGRPAYGCSVLLKLYLYGYHNRIRSSRGLATECERNIELWWLLEELRPKYKTIADFRKLHSSALKSLFVAFSKFCLGLDLYGGERIAVDGSKFGGQNSKKNNYSSKKLDQHLSYLSEKADSYLAQLNALDEQESEAESALEAAESRSKIEQKLAQVQEREEKYEGLKEELKASCEKQVSTTDPDARLLATSGQGGTVGYNVQSSVDSKHCMVAHFEVSNQTDHHALTRMCKESKEILEVEEIDALADQGYHTGVELQACAEAGIRTFVAPKSRVSAKGLYDKDAFVYQREEDQYICPNGQALSSSGTWRVKNAKELVKPYRVKTYKLPSQICMECPLKTQCLTEKMIQNKKAKLIERAEYETALENNQRRVKQNRDYYKQRQAMVEHPFGTIKRQWGYTHSLMKTISKVEADFALIFLTYNLKRAISILGVKQLIEKIKEGQKQDPFKYQAIRPLIAFAKARYEGRKVTKQSLSRWTCTLKSIQIKPQRTIFEDLRGFCTL
ncbi:MAG: IS1182 family transposase [Bacteroidota bacterium]